MKLSDIAISKLLDLITVQKKYQPGDKLPNEAGLAQELHVSRNTVRTAVRYLVGQGVLEIQIGRGTYVSKQSPVSEDFGFDALKYMHLKLRDLYELRLMLEPQMAYYAALRATDEELAQILALGRQVDNHSYTKNEDLEGNQLFHNAIVQATQRIQRQADGTAAQSPDPILSGKQSPADHVRGQLAGSSTYYAVSAKQRC